MRIGDALSLLVERADVIEAAGRTFLLIEATPTLMNFLKSYGAGRETCGACHRRFTARRSDAKYCGSACRQQAYRGRRWSRWLQL